METETWEKVENIFHIAIELPFAERNAFLQNECAGNGELISEVESLIKSFEKDSYILDEPVFELGLDAIGKKSQKNLANSTIGFYKLEEKIGAGGMGEVYKAVDTRLNRRVALKFLSASLENDNSAKRQLIKEAQAVAMLEHPNICAVHGIEETAEHHFIVMQYIEGKTLGESFKEKPIGVEDFKSITRQILTAVAFAHSHGVIHRDLKPGNIMLTDDGSIKVLDFGLAKIIPQNQLLGSKTGDEVSQFSNNGLVIGTVSYMSPEQLRGKKLDYRSDIFSIGIVLYELLAKQNPFNCESQAEVIAAILSNEPPNVKEFSADFPEPLVKLVEKCLQKNPDDRFQSAAEMLVELDNAETVDVVGLNSKRRKSFFIKAMLAIIVLIAVFAAGLMLYNRPSSRRTLAVLPISFINPPDGNEYLADGLTRSIIDKLSNLSDLKVKNESFVAYFKNKTLEPQAVGKELNVDAVYFGSISKRNDVLILTTKLIRTTDGLVIDTNEQEINEENLIELQQNISDRIINKIKSNLTEDDKSKLAKKDTENSEAKLLYIRGRYYLERQEGEDLKIAERYFRDATALDPVYAQAWTGLADTYTLFSVPGHKGAVSPKEAAKSAKAAAKQAIAIDDTLCEPYVSLGMINLRYEWNWDEAESHFKSAISRNSEFPQAHLGLSNLLIIKQDYVGSIAEAQKAKEFSPFSVLPDLSLARSFYFERNYEQMDKILSKSLENFPNHKRLNYFRGLQYLATGKLTEATRIFEKLYQEDKIYGAAPLALSYGRMGRKDEAQKILAVLDELSKQDGGDYVAPQERAIVYLGLGEMSKVFKYLTDSCDEKYPAFPFVISDPIFDEIRSDPRFADLKKCANL
jgi:serine/threonine-protein kinase